MTKSWIKGSFLILSACLGLAAKPAAAQVLFFVRNTNDSGPGSLRQAILNANASPGADGIEFSLDTGSPQRITLISGPLTIEESVEIRGPGADRLAIDGNFVFAIFRIRTRFGSALIEGLSIINGSWVGNSGGPGGIDSEATILTVARCAFANNTGQDGGGIGSNGHLRVTDCTFSGNTALRDGGAIFGRVTVSVSRSDFTGNRSDRRGGAVALDFGDLTVEDSRFAGNRAEAQGGAICRLFSSMMQVSRSTFEGNAGLSGGGIYSERGEAVVEDSVFTGNAGGGIFNRNSDLVVRRCALTGNAGLFGGGIGHEDTDGPGDVYTALIDRCVVSGNTAARQGGGIASSDSDMTVLNSTISANTAGLAGGGIFNAFRALSVKHCTLSGNSSAAAGGAVATSFGSLSLRNTILADSPGDGNCGSISRFTPILSEGHNLSSDDTCSGFLTGSGDRNNTDPLLGPLRDNGGPTFTHALLPGSPAIDAGDNTGAPPTDQRGFSRVLDGNGDGDPVIDVGAFEAPAVAPPPPPPPPPPACFDFHVPGHPESPLRLCQGNPPILRFHLVGFSPPGHARMGTVPLPTLAGAGTILSVQVIGRQVFVTAANGVYVSREGFLYAKQ